MKKIKKILISQPEPQSKNHPYSELATKHKIKIKFNPLIEIIGLNVRDIRLQKINVNNFSAIIFTSRIAIDHFFRICEEMRFTVPNTMKYFCVSEAISFYLQKYTAYRKRKIYVGGKKIQDLQEVIEKHNTEKFLLPSAENTNSKTIEFLDSLQINYTRGVFFKTLPKKTSIKRFSYDMVVLFSPIDVDSIIQNFPELFTKDHEILIACFGSVTQNYAESKNLHVELKAPNEKNLSMLSCLDSFLSKK